ncbi:adventurous gliding motility protein AgmC [Melittangium boletus]|uniref:Large repetitive protein n=1 Tax=Melittangium boletus DSM 14713 TaxID=1294270 RepID=A0A286NUU4_9BACT|nr:Ig-like domain-containing protein [Melittangium boletus]ATB26775.1 large repetitive protein [Melittangium boletus DSM 14713]
MRWRNRRTPCSKRGSTEVTNAWRRIATPGWLLWILLAASPTFAGPDSVGLGRGLSGNGDVTVTTARVINSYAQVRAPLAPGDKRIKLHSNTVTADHGRTTSNAFQTNDLVMVIQSTGIVPPIEHEQEEPLDLGNSDVGKWEFARLSAVAVDSGDPTTLQLSLSEPLLHTYAADATQVVRIPEYANLTVQNDITAAKWNGKTGGIVAFLATGAVTLSGTGRIHADGMGFRGGLYQPDTTNTVSCNGISGTPPTYAKKGEGIDTTRYDSTNTSGSTAWGRGNFANGAGGGFCVAASGGGTGGGGGGNAGQGGAGGPSFNGGMGGIPLIYSALERLTFGGGGGSGHAKSQQSSGVSGGAGGGLVFIRANSLAVSSDTTSSPISASGVAGGDGGADGGGGGGAGGTIVLRLATTSSCSGKSISANGGNGGNRSTSGNTVAGAGGGGGGGRILYQLGTSSTCTNANFQVFKGNATTNAGENGSTALLPGGFPGLSLPSPSLNDITTPTKNRQPEITGTAQADRQVVLYLNEVEIGRTYATSGGVFNYIIPQRLGDDSYTIKAAIAYQGVYSAKSSGKNFTVDATPPPVPVIETLGGKPVSQGMLIGTPDLVSSSLSVSGSKEERASIAVTQLSGDSKCEPASLGEPASHTPEGKWTASLSQTSHAQGTNVLCVTATDQAGNSSSPARLSFTLDTIAPTAPSDIKIAEKAPKTDSPIALVNTKLPLIAGTADPNNLVRLTLEWTDDSASFSKQSLVIETTAKADRKWSVAPPAPLKEYTATPKGQVEYTLTVQALDAAGNSATSALQPKIRVDVTPPQKPYALALGENSSPARQTRDGMFIGTSDLESSGGLPLMGKMEGGSKITVRQLSASGELLQDVTTNDNHSSTTDWSVVIPQESEAVELAYKLEVTATDATGNTSEATTLNFILDTKAPAAPYAVKIGGKDVQAGCASDTGPFVTTLQPLIEGRAEARSEISVTLNSASDLVPKTYTNGLSGDGNWATGLTTDLPSPPTTQKYSVTITAMDEAKNVSAPASHCFILDVKSPDPVALSSIELGKRNKKPENHEQRLLGIDDVDTEEGNQVTIRIRGVAAHESKVLLKLIPRDPTESVQDVTVYADASDKWTGQWTPLETGVYGVEIRAEDKASNRSDPLTFFFELDVTRPTIKIGGKPDNTKTPILSTHVSLAFSPSEPIEKFDCKIFRGGEEYTSPELTCTQHSLTGEVDGGSYKLSITVEDKAGNNSTSAEWEWIVDTEQATVVVESVPDTRETKKKTNKKEISFKIKPLKPESKVNCRLPEEEKWEVPCKCDEEIPNDLPEAPPSCIRKYTAPREGSYTFEAHAHIESPENSPPGPAVTWPWTFDNTAPVIAVTQRPPDWVKGGSGGNKNGAVTIKFIAENEADTPTFKYTLTNPNGSKDSLRTTDKTTIQLSFEGKDDGLYSLSIYATDDAGNTGQATDDPESGNDLEKCCSWTVDRKIPLAPLINSPQEGGHYKTLSLEGTAPGEAGSTISVFLDENNEPVGTTAVEAEPKGAEKWQLVIPASRVKDGPHSVTLRITDRALNTDSTSVSAPIHIEIDNLPPEVTIDEGPLKNSSSVSATFKFSANEAVSFQCKLDLKDPTDCESGVSFSDLPEGPHTLILYAMDQAGNKTELGYSWSVYLGLDARAEGSGLSCASVSDDTALPWLMSLIGLLLGLSRRRETEKHGQSK